VTLGRGALILATAGALGLVARSTVRGLPSPAVAATALALYVGLVLLGVLFSRFGMFGEVLVRGPRGARGVALTFDDGPDPATTPKILELLAAAGAKAAFFVIGRKAEQHPELVREIVAGGHALGVHGYAHDRLFALRRARTLRADLRRAIGVLEAISGQRPRLFRAPLGHVSPPVAAVARELELEMVGWTVKSLDGWSGATLEGVLARVLPRLDDRVIVLLHDAAERGDFVPASLGALPEILAVAARRRLEVVRVDAWLEPAD
jgi:peptidoglycan/xylan/chitin deacetylase (PgdA/CDA1 family)